MDRIQLIDDAVETLWMSTYVSTLTGATSHVAGSRRPLMNLLTDKDDDTKRIKLPRITLMRLGVMGDPERHRRGRMRSVAYTDAGLRTAISVPFPLAVKINYQVDFWTRMISEMNQWIIQFHTDFILQTKYLKIAVDEFFRNKWVCLLNDGELTDNSDLETGEDRPLLRYTAQLVAETWIFPTEEQARRDPTVHEIFLNVYDQDETLLAALTAP